MMDVPITKLLVLVCHLYHGTMNQRLDAETLTIVADEFMKLNSLLSLKKQ
jgi:hypothetical protein